MFTKCAPKIRLIYISDYCYKKEMYFVKHVFVIQYTWQIRSVFDHYVNTPMQHTAIFHGCKNDNFWLKLFDHFHIFAQNIDCVYTLEPSH